METALSTEFLDSLDMIAVDVSETTSYQAHKMIMLSDFKWEVYLNEHSHETVN